MSRRPRSSDAYSLLEVVVTVGIFSVIALSVGGAILQSTKEVRTTSDYSLSVFLSQRVGEDLLQGANENPYLEESLSEISGVSTPVANGLNPFFAVIEDDRAPFGRLEPGSDLGINPRAADLSRLYKDFSLTLTTRAMPVTELPGSPQYLNQADLHYAWPGLQRAEREYLLPCVLSMQVTKPAPIHPLARDVPGMDAAIRTVLYPEHPGDLVSAVVDAGADLETVRDLGSIVVLARDVENQSDELLRAAKALEAETPERNPAARENPEVRISLGKLYEKLAALAWQALLVMESPANRSKSFDKQQIGNSDKADWLTIMEGVSEAHLFREQFGRSMKEAARHYAVGRNNMDPLVRRAFRTLAIEKRILELEKLQALRAGSPDLQYLHAWIDYLTEIYRARNRMVSDYLTRERDHCRTLASIQSFHPLIVTKLESTESAHGSLTQLLRNVRLQYLRLTR